MQFLFKILVFTSISTLSSYNLYECLRWTSFYILRTENISDKVSFPFRVRFGQVLPQFLHISVKE